MCTKLKEDRNETSGHKGKKKRTLEECTCILKCTQILLYNLVSFCEWKHLKGSVAVSQIGSCFGHF